MKQTAKIFVAGHRGLVGSALVRALEKRGYTNLLTVSRQELDLRNQAQTDAFFQREKPDYVFMAAAKVGGIHANATYPADFIYDNVMLQTNLVHAARQAGVQRLLFLGSACIYPKFAAQPISESALLEGALEPTNRAYAVAKISGIEMCWSYNRQYGTRYLAVMPANLYGAYDNFHPENSHVIPGLIRRFHEARVNGSPEVRVWGTGQVLREFLYSDDMADACLFLMTLEEGAYSSLLDGLDRDGQPPLVNIGTGEEVSIADLARMVQQVVGYQGRLVFDSDKPDGIPRKLLDSQRLAGLGWRPRISLTQGLERAYAAFLKGEAR